MEKPEVQRSLVRPMSACGLYKNGTSRNRFGEHGLVLSDSGYELVSKGYELVCSINSGEFLYWARSHYFSRSNLFHEVRYMNNMT